MLWQVTKAIVLNYVLGSGRDIKTYVFINIIRLLNIVLMQADAEWIFPQYFLVGTAMLHHCIAEFLTCPVNFKNVYSFQGSFLWHARSTESKGQKKTWFWFWYDHIRYGCPSLQRGLSFEDNYFTYVTSQATWFWSRLSFSVHFQLSL